MTAGPRCVPFNLKEILDQDLLSGLNSSTIFPTKLLPPMAKILLPNVTSLVPLRPALAP